MEVTPSSQPRTAETLPLFGFYPVLALSKNMFFHVFYLFFQEEFAVLVDFKNPGDKKKTGWGTPLQPGPAATQG